MKKEEFEKQETGEFNQIKDESPDHNNFVQIPLVVVMLSRDPYDVSFWMTVKQIAWKEGSECYLSTAELAILGMMSISKASDCRNYLIETGLLNGKLEQIPGSKMKSVWHLSIPPIWGMNENFMRGIKGWKARIEYKRQQAEDLKEQRVSKRGKANFSSEFGSDTNIPDEFDSNIPGEFGQESNSSGEFDSVPEKFAFSSGNDNIYKDPILSKKIDDSQPFNASYVWSQIELQLQMTYNKKYYEDYIQRVKVKGWDGFILVLTSDVPLHIQWLDQMVEATSSRLLKAIINNSQASVRFELGFGKMV